MGSCLSKPASKGHTKTKRKEAHCVEERDTPAREEPLKASEEEGEGDEELGAPCKNVVAACQNLLRATQEPFPAQSFYTKPAESQELQLPAWKDCLSPSFPPDPPSLPLTTQTPMRKSHSGELPLRKPSSSPCRSLLLKMPSSPASMKISTSFHKNEEAECKFPSLARKQWLSQTHVTEENDSLTMRSKASAGEGASKYRMSSSRETLTQPIRETMDMSVGKELAQQTSSKVKEELIANATKQLIAEAPTLASRTAPSRTNSLSREMSPVKLSRVKGRPSSTLKRSPSIKDHSMAATDCPTHLVRTSQGKFSSPNRAGLQAAERHESWKARPLHKQSHSNEYIADPASDPLVHKRSSSRDSVSEFSPEVIRKPSPPKKTLVLAPLFKPPSTLEGGRLNSKQPSMSSKEDLTLHKPPSQEPSCRAEAGKVSAQRGSSTEVYAPENLTSISNNRNGKRKEKSPITRACNGMATFHNSTRNSNRRADLSINLDNMAASHFDLPDLATKTRRPASRPPLKEISDNTTKPLSTKLAGKEKSRAASKSTYISQVFDGIDAYSLQVKEEPAKGYASLGKFDEKVVCDLSTNTLSDYAKDSLEVKAESLVMGGKSVLSAFKTLEEYRLKCAHLNLELPQAGEKGAWYTRSHPHTVDKENFSQPLQGSETEKAPPASGFQQARELPRSQSAKKSCEQFLFPGVQSITSENERFQLDGVGMPASISKACSILRAVADLNMSVSTYPKKKEVQDEIERPNLLSFQFGEGDRDRVIF